LFQVQFGLLAEMVVLHKLHLSTTHLAVVLVALTNKMLEQDCKAVVVVQTGTVEIIMDLKVVLVFLLAVVVVAVETVLALVEQVDLARLLLTRLMVLP
jgi:hypothetical protein